MPTLDSTDEEVFPPVKPIDPLDPILRLIGMYDGPVPKTTAARAKSRILIRVDSPPDTEEAVGTFEARLTKLGCDEETWPPGTELTPELEAVSKQWPSMGYEDQNLFRNPFRKMFRPNPFEWPDSPEYFGLAYPEIPGCDYWFYALGRPDPRFDELPPDDIEKLPVPLKNINELPITEDMKCIGCADDDSKVVYRVRHGEDVKIFSLYKRRGDGLEAFKRERDAYSNFVSYNVTSHVPCVYGWFDITPESVTRAKRADWLSPSFMFGFYVAEDPKFSGMFGLLTEHIDGEELHTSTITIPIGCAALRSLAAVHKARVLHRDVALRHFRIQRRFDGDRQTVRVVLIDFDHSYTYPDERVNRFELWKEIKNLWRLLFEHLLPDKRLGIIRDSESCAAL